jgi:prepilin peptidase CpaA
MTSAIAHSLILLGSAALLFAALHDIAFRTVPDWVSAALVVLGGALRLRSHNLPAGLGCGLAVFALAAFCWWRGWLGGGDVKLLGATAVLVPPALVPGYIAAVALAGGGLALLYLLMQRVVTVRRQRRPASFLRRILVVEARRIHRRTSLPYATAISAASLLMLAQG